MRAVLSSVRPLPAVVLLALGGCGLWPATTAAGGTGPELEQRVRRIANGLRSPLRLVGERVETHRLQARMKELKVPAVSIAVIDGYRVAWSRAWGVADAGTGRPATVDTPFYTASMAKTVAATTALRLVADGRLRLDQPVNDALRSWSVPDNEWTRQNPVTVGLVLGHRAGFPRGYFDLPADGPMPALADMLAGDDANLRGVVVRTPGTGYEYSNIGYGVLQLLLEDAAGVPYAELVQGRVLEPLGMADTVCDPLDNRVQQNVASGHDRDGSPVPEIGLVPPAVAGLWATSEDFARLVAALLRAWRGDDDELLPEHLVMEMFRPTVEGYGLGVRTTGRDEALNVQHAGGHTGFRCRFMAFPATGQGAVVMVNSDRGVPIISETLAAIGAEYAWPGHPVEGRVVDLGRSRLESTEGSYRCIDAPQYVLRVTVEGSALSTQINEYRPVTYRPVGEDRFVDPRSGRTIEFRRDGDGRIVGLVSGRAGYAEPYFARESASPQ
jgi:CubicO group peptidase (beta-lactamase class C family)